MNAASRRNSNSNGVPTVKSGVAQEHTARKLFLPTLMALGGGCGLLSGTASGLELGELRVHSTLGHPLRASVAYALQPNEQIHDYCIYVRPGLAASGLPSIGNAAISLTNGSIQVTGQKAIREPLLSLQLTVDCPHAAHLRREYSVFLDFALPAEARTPATPPRVLEPAAAAVTNESGPAPSVGRPAAPRPAAPRTVVRAPMTPGSSYRVQSGDSLSMIAAGIPQRSVGIWQAVDAIFAANPDAFIEGDVNRLRAGTLLAIPDSILVSGSESATSAYSASRPRGRQAAPTPAAAAELPELTPETVTSTETLDTSVTSVTSVTSDVAPAEPVDAAHRDPRSGSPFVLPIDESGPAASGTFTAPTEVIPSTRVQDAAAQRSSSVARTTNDTWSWLIWLGGSGIALIVALLLFGRRLKDLFAPAPGREGTPAQGANKGRLDETDVSPAPGLPAAGTTRVARRLSLDGDLEDGMGFGYGDDMDVAQDFGFSNSGSFESSLDMDLTGAAADEVQDHTTNIIRPQRMREESIVVSETPPSHEDTGEYDLSMIVDATKQELGGTDETTRDLRVVQVDAESDASGGEDETLSREVDYKILEQDYEEELTATQALNAEIAEAARALSRQFGKNEMGDTLADTMSETPGMTDEESIDQGSVDEGWEDDRTALLPGTGDAGYDNPAAAMPTVKAEGDEPGEEAGEETAQMPARGPALSLEDTANDPTVEVASGTAERKARASR